MASRIGCETAAPVTQRLRVMQPQDLDVRNNQAAAFDARQHFGQSRCISARENIFVDPFVGAARSVAATDRVYQRHPVARQATCHGIEEFTVVPDADMLEHAN